MAEGQIFEQDIALVRIGQEIEAKVAAAAGPGLQGAHHAIGSASDLTTRRVVVRSEIGNPDGAAQVRDVRDASRSSIASDRPAPAVPIDAVIREGDVATVWVETEPMLFKRRVVEIGIAAGRPDADSQGLAVGELVVARGAIFVDNEWRQ